MTTSTSSAARTSRSYLRFALHFIEMVVAMFVGMIVLGPLWSLAWPGLDGNMAAGSMVMATNMTIAMALWMRIRRHSWPRIWEMSAVMYLPFAALLVPYWLGVIPAGVLMIAAHAVMIPLMLVAMLWRRDEYLGHHH